MAKRKSNRKRLRNAATDLEEARALIETPRCANSFFIHLNGDVRNIIYDLLSLPPFGDGREWSGLFLSCHQAKAEMEEAAAYKLRATFSRFNRAFETIEERAVALAKEISSGDGLAGLKTMEIVIPGCPCLRYLSGMLFQSLDLHALKVLKLHFNEIAQHSLVSRMPAAIIIRGLCKDLRCLLPNLPLWIQCTQFTITWLQRQIKMPTPRRVGIDLRIIPNGDKEKVHAIQMKMHP